MRCLRKLSGRAQDLSTAQTCGRLYSLRKARPRKIKVIPTKIGRYGSMALRLPIHEPLTPSASNINGPRQQAEAAIPVTTLPIIVVTGEVLTESSIIVNLDESSLDSVPCNGVKHCQKMMYFPYSAVTNPGDRIIAVNRILPVAIEIQILLRTLFIPWPR